MIPASTSTRSGSSAPLGSRTACTGRMRTGRPGGPISEAIAKAIEEGYSPRTGGLPRVPLQGAERAGPGGAAGRARLRDQGVMIGGFALMAVPAEYGVTGVKTFIVSHDGIVYEKDLGPDSEIAKKMERYNPDKTWQRTDDEWLVRGRVRTSPQLSIPSTYISFQILPCRDGTLPGGSQAPPSALR